MIRPTSMKSTQHSHFPKNENLKNVEFQHLDISYIYPNLIAMSYPSNKAECEKRPGRNKIEEVKQFLEENHKWHYYVINLCLEESERSYSPEIFEDRVWFFGITDHTPPPFELLLEICEKIKRWLDVSKRNVIVIHCKAGKGRTGTVSCCFLLYQGIVSTAQEALELYTSKRKIRLNQITSSQRRWIGYFESYLRNDRQYNPTPILIHSIRFETTKSFKKHRKYLVSLGWMDGSSKRKTNVTFYDKRKDRREISLVLKHPKKVNQDFQLNFFGLDRTIDETEASLVHLFQFWINTGFLNDVSVGEEHQHHQFIRLEKEELELSTTGEDLSNLPSDFMVTVYYSRLAQD